MRRIKGKTCRGKSKRNFAHWRSAISTYAQTVRQQFPTGDVVVSERDLAAQLRKRPENGQRPESADQL
jgi:hypothetical protein